MQATTFEELGLPFKAGQIGSVSDIVTNQYDLIGYMQNGCIREQAPALGRAVKDWVVYPTIRATFTVYNEGRDCGITLLYTEATPAELIDQFELRKKQIMWAWGRSRRLSMKMNLLMQMKMAFEMPLIEAVVREVRIQAQQDYDLVVQAMRVSRIAAEVRGEGYRLV